jgi:hypothetical protein
VSGLAHFMGPRLKIERAEEHIRNLEEQIAAFLAKQPYRLIVAPGDAADQQSIKVEIREALPTSISLIAGDAAHNLRASLDHLACDVVSINGGSTKDVYFPISKEYSKLNKTVSNRLGHATTAVRAFVEKLEPCAAGNKALYGLHRIDIVDKHIVILAIGHVMSVSSTFIGKGVLTIIPETLSTQLIQNGDIIAKIQRLAWLNDGVEVPAEFEIAFGADTAFPGEPMDTAP